MARVGHSSVDRQIADGQSGGAERDDRSTIEVVTQPWKVGGKTVSTSTSNSATCPRPMTAGLVVGRCVEAEVGVEHETHTGRATGT